MKQHVIQSVANTIIDELEAFEKGFKPQTDLAPSIHKAINQANYYVAAGQDYLRYEPFIAYIKAEINGEEQVLFVCRNQIPMRYQPVVEKAQFISHKAPLGKVASFEPGDEDVIYTPQGRCEVLVLEKNIFKPKRTQYWDGIENQLSTFTDDKRLDSLRKYYRNSKNPLPLIETKAEKTFIEKAEKSFIETAQNTIIEIVSTVLELPEIIIDDEEKPSEETEFLKQISTEILESFALRDRPILDRTQEDIFRLPLASQVILTGAPGTGKTTVLIRRLAQKSQPDFIADEIAHLTEEQRRTLFAPNVNWVIFTPNELLRSFLKESLNKEGLPADSGHVKIWKDYKSQIAVQNLQILRIEQRGVFIKSQKNLLQIRKTRDLTRYFAVFEKFFCQKIEKRLKKSVQNLSINLKHKLWQQQKYAEIFAALNDLASRISRVYNSNFVNIRQDSTEDFPAIFDLLRRGSQTSRDLAKQINSHIAEIVRRSAQMSPQVFKIIRDSVTAAEKYSDEKDLQQKTLQKLWRVLLWGHQGARTNLVALKNRDAENDLEESETAKLCRQISPLFSNEIKTIFATILFPLADTRRAIREIEWALGGYEKIVEQIPNYYNEFRQQQIDKKRFRYFSSEDAKDIKEKRLSQPELDILIYFMLREARRIFRADRSLLQTSTNNDLLENVKMLYRTQVVVDEATDFSAIELGCMYNLSHPQFDSVFLAGDLMQRVTSHGLQSWDECEFFSDKFQKNSLIKAYRQSPRLVSIAARLYEKIIGVAPDFKSAFIEKAADPAPLVFQPKNSEQLGQWLLERILEVIRLNNYQLPSIAIFVSKEDQINELYELLEEPFNCHSIDLEKCHNGQILGNEAKVRIFSIEHIKGLEFGAVFLINLDEINSQYPSLVNKYLYVALTRATTFLGITHTKAFPREIAVVIDAFENSKWITH